MAVDATLNLSLVANSTKTAVMGNSPHDPLNFVKQSILTNGTGAGQADVLYYAERTINASSNDDLDLTGTLTDNIGRTVSPLRVKGLIVVAAPSASGATANTNNVVLGAAGSNQWATLLNTTGTVTLRPGALFMAWAGQADATAWAITAGTGDILRVANSAGGSSVTYQIMLLGCSA